MGTHRLLWYHVSIFITQVLSWTSWRLLPTLVGDGIHALRLVLRLHGWQGCAVEEEELVDGAGARFAR